MRRMWWRMCTPTIGRRCVPRLPPFSRRSSMYCRTSSLHTRTVVSYVWKEDTMSRRFSPTKFSRMEAWLSSSSSSYLPIRASRRRISLRSVHPHFVNHRQVCRHIINTAFNLLTILFRTASEDILVHEIGRYLRFLSKYYSRFPDSIYGMIEVHEPLIEFSLFSSST